MIFFATGWSDAGARAIRRRYPVALWYEPGAATTGDVVRAVTGAECDLDAAPAPTDSCAPRWMGAARCDGSCRSR